MQGFCQWLLFKVLQKERVKLHNCWNWKCQAASLKLDFKLSTETLFPLLECWGLSLLPWCVKKLCLLFFIEILSPFSSLSNIAFPISRLMVEIVFLSKRKKWKHSCNVITRCTISYQNAIKLNIFSLAYHFSFFSSPQMLLIIIIFHVKTSRSFLRLNFMFE